MSDFVQQLTRRLAQPLPGPRAQRWLAPDLSFGRHFDPAPPDAMPAAVVAVLYPKDDGWYLPLTVRPETLLHHGGQISLPGGQIEADESSRDAALREFEEELRIAPAQVRLLGELTPVYVFSSNFQIHPWLAVATSRPNMQPDAREVARLIELPIAALCDRSNYGRHERKRNGVTFQAPHLDWQGDVIWGATLLILGELAALCDDVSQATK